jgi:hypothetical protein
MEQERLINFVNDRPLPETEVAFTALMKEILEAN